MIFVLKQEANIISDINIIYVHPDLSCYLQHKINKLAKSKKIIYEDFWVVICCIQVDTLYIMIRIRHKK